MSQYIIPALAGAALIGMVLIENRKSDDDVSPVSAEAAQELAAASAAATLMGGGDPAFVAVCENGVSKLKPHARDYFEIPANADVSQYCDCLRTSTHFVGMTMPFKWEREKLPIALEFRLTAANERIGVKDLQRQRGQMPPVVEGSIIRDAMNICHRKLYTDRQY